MPRLCRESLGIPRNDSMDCGVELVDCQSIWIISDENAWKINSTAT